MNGLPDAIAAPVWVVMQAGSLGAVAAAGGVAMWLGSPRAAGAASLSGVVVWAACKELKRHIGRGRPADHLEAVRVRGRAQSGLGYPSGHSAVAASLALVLAAGAPAPVGLALAATAVSVGFGRAYTGAHLPLDIVGGFGFGAAAGAATRMLLDL